jgi:ABC-type phosphate transport system substrate-binding protein
MRRWLSCFKPLLLGLALLAASPSRAGDDSHVLIVAHPALTVANLTADDLSRIYLLRQSLWPDGVPVVPLNREASSTVRNLFTTEVLKQTANTLATHWQQMHFKGKNPPLVQESDLAVLAFVQKVPGAIGYVSADTPVGDGVKVLGKLP